MFVNKAGKIVDTRRASVVSMVKLLDPKGLLTKVFSSSAIKIVNDKVSKLSVPKTASFSSFSPVESIFNKHLTLIPA